MGRFCHIQGSVYRSRSGDVLLFGIGQALMQNSSPRCLRLTLDMCAPCALGLPVFNQDGDDG